MPHARPRGRDVFGLLLLDKPMGWSSNRALQWVKRLYRANKAGHGGSLDPLATGMLPIFFGAATRLCAYLLEAEKTYRVTAILGTATTTGDAEGDVTLDRADGYRPEPTEIEPVLAQFRGDIMQVPPMYSALKRGGVPLYRLARQGVQVERAARRVTIETLTLEGYEWPELRLLVSCSKGTYIRTLVEDIAAALDTAGHVGALRRLGVAPFGDRGMHRVEELEGAASGAAGLAGRDAEPCAGGAFRPGSVRAVEPVRGAGLDSGLCRARRVHWDWHGWPRRRAGARPGFSALTAWSGIEILGMMRPFHRQAKRQGR